MQDLVLATSARRALALPETTPEPRPETLTDQLYKRLRRAIVRGELRPNQRLVELELAESLKVSRTPVREALQRLALDRLVVSHRRGWTVHEHSIAEIKDIYTCRETLEGCASRLAATNATKDQLAALTKLVKAAATETRPARLWRAATNDAFHDGVIDAAHNPVLADLCQRSRLYYFNDRIAGLYGPGEVHPTHGDILAAISNRDGNRAERLAREHVANALQVLLEKLD